MPSLLRSADVNRAESTICTKSFYAMQNMHVTLHVTALMAG
jgi:hypothetical protein